MKARTIQVGAGLLVLLVALVAYSGLGDEILVVESEVASGSWIDLERELAQFESTINGSVEVGFEELQKHINAMVPKEMNGVVADPFGSKIKDDTLNWSVNRKGIKIGEKNGRLGASVGSIFKVNLEGKVLFDFSATADGIAEISAGLKPKIRRDWTIHPGLSAVIDVKSADVKIKHFGSLSVKSVLQKSIDAEILREVEKLNEKTAKKQILKPLIENVWLELEPARRLNPGNEPPLWLRTVPSSVVVSNPRIGSTKVVVNAGIRANLSVHVGAMPPASHQELPVEIEVAGSEELLTSTIFLPAHVGMDSLNVAIDQNVEWPYRYPVDVESSGPYMFVESVDVEAFEGELKLALKVNVSPASWWRRGLKGTVYLRAKPRLSADGKVVHFDKMYFEAPSRKALEKSAAWMLNDAFAHQLSKSIQIDVDKLIKKAGGKGQLFNYSLQSGNGILAVEQGDAKLEKIQVSEAGLILIAKATGTLRFRVE